jgi:hypothetical protein
MNHTPTIPASHPSIKTLYQERHPTHALPPMFACKKRPAAVPVPICEKSDKNEAIPSQPQNLSRSRHRHGGRPCREACPCGIRRPRHVDVKESFGGASKQGGLAGRSYSSLPEANRKLQLSAERVYHDQRRKRRSQPLGKWRQSNGGGSGEVRSTAFPLP